MNIDEQIVSLRRISEELKEQNDRLVASGISLHEIRQQFQEVEEEVKLVDKESGNEIYADEHKDQIEYGEYELQNPYKIETLSLRSTMR
jgi:hypothetical protein